MPDGSQLILGRQENTSSAETRITRSGAADVPAFAVLDGSGTAIAGSADRQPGVWGGSREHNGIVGTSVLANGVWGRSCVPGAAGVFGENVSGYGIVATTRGFGVGLYARGLDRQGISTDESRSKGICKSVEPSRPRWRTPMARTDYCTHWRAQRVGLRTSGGRGYTKVRLE